MQSLEVKNQKCNRQFFKLNVMKKYFFIAIIAIAISACNAPKKPVEKTEAPAVMVETNLRVEGMSCTGCEQTIAKGVNELAGIDSISANHLDSTAFVRFDSNKTNLAEITKAIEGRGYEVVPETKTEVPANAVQ